MTDNGHEALPPEYCPEDLLGVDKAAVGGALFRTELIVLAPEVGVREGLVGNRDLLENLFGVWVVGVLVGVVFDRQSPCR